ncbi:MAG TPA: hypothetical protein PKJ68_04750 [Candidatus Woesebacteria bacterium]|nr:hypothetical protein [Candidatus Woesebacteria bacterium]
MLKTIITSKTRRAILQLFFQSPSDTYYLRDIVRRTGEEVNAVKRELDILTKGKVLESERRLNKIFFRLHKNYIFFDEFLRMFAKTSRIALLLKEAGPKLGKVKALALSLKYARKLDIRADEIYLLGVGTIVLPEIAQVISYCEQEFGREINYTVMTEDELAYRKRNNDPFIWKFLRTPKVMLLGTEEDLLK